MKNDILIYLLKTPSASAGQISQEIEKHPRDVQNLLIQMDDNGDVIMKNGFYRISEVARLKALKSLDDQSV